MGGDEGEAGLASEGGGGMFRIWDVGLELRGAALRV